MGSFCIAFLRHLMLKFLIKVEFKKKRTEQLHPFINLSARLNEWNGCGEQKKSS